MRRYRPAVVMLAAYALLGCSQPELADSDIIALSATALRTELASGRLTALRVTQTYLRRIAALDAAGPSLAAVIEVNSEAEAIARDLDQRLRSGAVAGPLHGVPVLLKANIDTADAMATSAGSVALAEHRAAVDADIVTRLRAAGAVVLGKTNLSEWANFRSTSSTSGWSSLGGQTRNAYVLDRNPCGSSSGSAVAVAARLAPLAVATETDGSIVCPAAANGVVGIKPAIGTVSQRGIVPIAHSQDTAGPMARSVADAALLLSVLVERAADPSAFAADRDVTGLRVGVIRNFQGSGRDAAVEASFATALVLLRQAGAVLVDPVDAALASDVEDAELELLLAEFDDDLGAYLRNVERGPRSLDELIAFNNEHAATAMPYFGQELLIAARESGGTASPRYAAARATVAAARASLSALLAERDLDALVAPANSRAWRTSYATGDEYRVSSSSLAAITGYPSVTVPIAVAGELPLGLALIGKPDEETTLLSLAAAIERGRGEFPQPRFLPSVGD